MRLSDFEIVNRTKLNLVLLKLCKMIIQGQRRNSEYYGLVAAAVIDPQDRRVYGVNYFVRPGKRVHAERAAIDKYVQQYGEIPAGSIIVTTLSPCSQPMREREGESCTDLINKTRVGKVYCGYEDPTQTDTLEYHSKKFHTEVTGNSSIEQLCKMFADQFLNSDTITEDEESPFPSVDRAKQMLPQLLARAQKDYDDWDEEDRDTYAGGGICHIIADSICDVLGSVGINSSPVSCSYEQHVYVAAQFEEGTYSIDIPYHIYEEGGGFSWRKLPGVKFQPRDVVFYRVGDAEEFDEYIGLTEDIGNDPNGYMSGHCHVMALALKKLHPQWRIRAHIGWEEDSEDDSDYRVDHVYAVDPKTGAAYDCRGRFSSEEDLVGPDNTGGVETRLVDYSLDDIKHDILRGELKMFNRSDIAQAMEVAEKISEDYDPNGTPPGPEIKPTMPKGTVRVDVSDVYDWYKLGKNISNLDRADPKMFGKGPPSTVISFGDEDTEHKYIQDLMKLGLTTTDIDPKAHDVRKNQKVDTTFNVDENFHDGKKPGRKGLAKRSGVNCKQSISKLRSIAANSSGERQRMAHWCANMKSGRKKK